MGRKGKEFSLGVTTVQSSANTCTTNKQTRAKRSSNSIDVKQDELIVNKDSVGAPIEETLLKDEDDLTFNIKRPAVIKTYKSKVKKIDANMLDNQKKSSCTISTAEFQPPAIISDINQRPRRQIKHKFIKARRNVTETDPIPPTPQLATDTTINLKKKSKSQDNVKQISTKSENNSEILAGNESLLLSNYKLARVVISDNLNSHKKNNTKTKTAKNIRRSGRQNTRSGDTTDEDLSITSNCISLQSNIDDSLNSNDTNDHQLVEIIEADDTHDIVEEIVQTTTQSTIIADNICDDTESYELYQVIDNDNDAPTDELHAETSDTKPSFLVAVEETNSNSQFSQNSLDASEQKIFVEISESVDNQQSDEVITPFDSSDSQTSAINIETINLHKRNSFSGAFKSVSKRKSKRLCKNENNSLPTNNEQICLNDNDTSTSNNSSDIDLSNPSTVAMLQLKRLGVSIKRVNTNKNSTTIDSSDSDKSNKELAIAKSSAKSSISNESSKIQNTLKPASIGTKRRSTRLCSTIVSTNKLFEKRLLENNLNLPSEINFGGTSAVQDATKDHKLQSPTKLINEKKSFDNNLKDKLEPTLDKETDNNQFPEKDINSVEFDIELYNETVTQSIDKNAWDNQKIASDNNSEKEIITVEKCPIDNSTVFVQNKNLKTYSKRKDKLNTEKLTEMLANELTKSISATQQDHEKFNEQSTPKNDCADNHEIKNHFGNNEKISDHSINVEKLSSHITVERSRNVDNTTEQKTEIEINHHHLEHDDNSGLTKSPTKLTENLPLPFDSSVDESNELSLVENYLKLSDSIDDNDSSTISTEHSSNQVNQTKTTNDHLPNNSKEFDKKCDTISKISITSETTHDTTKNGDEKIKSYKSKHRNSDSKRHDKRSKQQRKHSKETESDQIASSSPNKKSSADSRASIEQQTTSYDKPSTSKKSTESVRDKHTSPVINDAKINKEKHKKNRLAKESLSNVSKNVPSKPKDAYSILSECYLPKMVKHDESLYSIEAFKAAQTQAIADAKAQAEASAKARAEAAAKAAAAAVKAREEAMTRLREEAAAKAREEAAAIKAREDEEKAKVLAAANRARERAAAKQRAAEAAKAREQAVKLAIEAAAKLLEEENKKLIEETKKNLFSDEPLIKTEKVECNELSTSSENQSTESYFSITKNISATDFAPEYSTVIDENIAKSSDIKTELIDFETAEEETTIRRSGRLRTKTETNKREHGFGLVRDRERYLPYTMVSSSADHGYGSLLSEASSFSGSLTDLNDSCLTDIKEESTTTQPYQQPIKTAAEKEEELKNIAEGLGLFEQISDNEYKCERIISKESKKMQCDCFLTKSEIDRGELGCGEDCLNRLLMIECGSRCVVGDRCTNKRFQKIMNADCTIFKTDKKGFGMKAAAIIPEGEFIMEYVGEVLNSKQFEQRVEDYSHDKNIHHYFMALRNDCIIDATSRGNISRFINHSCDPNAETQKWTVNGELRVGFFSRRTIYPDQEITFDYKFRRYGKEAQRCYCNAENCRGWIGEEPDSDDEFEEGEEEEEEEDGTTVNDERKDKATDIDDKNDLVSNVLDTLETNLQQITSEESKLDTNVELSHEEISSTGDSTSTKTLSSIETTTKHRLPKIKREKSKQRLKHTDISEDQDLDMEISILTKSNLKNQSHTLRFSRLMVRAKQQRAKSQLLYILRCGELACRRLFLDYHGLKLLYAWMCDRISKDMKIEWAFRLEILETLEVLPIPNKTMLKESKVLATIDKWSQIIDLKDCQAEHKSPDESPIDNNVTGDDIANSPTNEQNNEQLISQIRYIASKLLSSWETLTEVFKIPKKLRIEQMKEHEREADLSYQALGLQTDVIAADEEEQRRKRFRRDTTTATTTGRETWDKDKYYWEKDRTNRYKDTKESSTEWNMWKIQRRQMFEAQVGVQDTMAAGQKRFEDDSVHAAKCSFFRIDPRITSRRSIPFCVNPITGQWYTEDKRPITAPPSHSHIKPPPQQKSKNPNDYNLPALDLPEHWKYAIDDHGQMYYYHAKIRIPQWEPPIKLLPLFAENKNADDTNMIKLQKIDNQPENNVIQAIRNEFGGIGDNYDEFSSDSDDGNSSVEELSDLLNKLTKSLNEKQLRVDNMFGNPMQSLSDEISALATDQIISPTPTTSTAALTFSPVPAQSITNKAEFDARFESLLLANQKKKRRAGLVSERTISPRTDEERIELKLEMRRYRENKEKLRRRKEEAKRRRQIVAETVEPPKKHSKLVDGLPSLIYNNDDDDDDDTSDEDERINSVENKIDNRTVEIQDEPLIPICIDELEALKNSVDTTIAINKSSHKSDHKPTTQKHKKSSSKSSSLTSSSNSSNSVNHVNSEDAKRIKDKFRAEIAGVIVQHLSPYRKENCQIGRITNNEDFKHLAKKLTHFVMLKELKHCDNTINVLVVTDSVKQKSKEFIRKYMGKFGKVYTKPDNEPEYKDFNNSQ